jgi:hypothetical protein
MSSETTNEEECVCVQKEIAGERKSVDKTWREEAIRNVILGNLLLVLQLHCSFEQDIVLGYQ